MKYFPKHLSVNTDLVSCISQGGGQPACTLRDKSWGENFHNVFATAVELHTGQPVLDDGSRAALRI